MGKGENKPINKEINICQMLESGGRKTKQGNGDMGESKGLEAQCFL